MYGVLSYLVTQRTCEIGIRRALRVRISQVMALILRRSALLIGARVTVGLLGVLGLTRQLEGATVRGHSAGSRHVCRRYAAIRRLIGVIPAGPPGIGSGPDARKSGTTESRASSDFVSVPGRGGHSVDRRA